MSGGSENGKFDDFRGSRQKFLEEIGDVSKTYRPIPGFRVFLRPVSLFPGGQYIWKMVIPRAKMRITQDVCKRVDYFKGKLAILP